MTFRSQDLKRMVDTYGKSLTLTAKGSPTYDTDLGTVVTSDSTYITKVFFYNYNLVDIDGMNIRLGDRRAVIGLLDTSGDAIPEPETGDELTGEGDKVQIVRTAKIMSGDSAVCYLCQVRE